VAHVATAPTDVELALWFHDVVYKPLSARNERASASWATRSLEGGSAPAATVDRVVAFIMATEHKEAPEDPDARLVVDIDLAVLGRDRDGYQLYEDGVRKEFSWVPGATFRNRRATVLSKFLKRPSIYCTKTFQERYEKQARKNLESAIAKLRRGG
jgi:predicted metal-dependent HD superfamily phosphohydrolase